MVGIDGPQGIPRARRSEPRVEGPRGLGEAANPLLVLHSYKRADVLAGKPSKGMIVCYAG
jgi:hypothetical protein